MHFMHLCYAKEEWWKEFHHWKMEFQLPLLLLPVVISAAGGAALRTGGKSPALQSCWADVLGLFIFHVPLLCSRGKGREMLRGLFRAVKPAFKAIQVPCQLRKRAEYNNSYFHYQLIRRLSDESFSLQNVKTFISPLCCLLSRKQLDFSLNTSSDLTSWSKHEQWLDYQNRYSTKINLKTNFGLIVAASLRNV